MQHDPAEFEAVNETAASIFFRKPDPNKPDSASDKDSEEHRNTSEHPLPLDNNNMGAGTSSASRPDVPEDVLYENASAESDSQDSDDWDKDWLSHVNSLSIWASPLSRISFVLFLVGIAITVSQASSEVINYKLACQVLIKNRLASPVEQQCDPVQTQEIVSTFLMWDLVIYSVVSLITCTKVSALSDIYGRKPFLTAFVVLTSVNSFIKYFLVSTTNGYPMVAMWCSTVIGATSGGSVALVALFKAYITDISRPLDRVSAMSCTVVAFSLGQIVGPSLSSFVLSYSNQNENAAIPKVPHVSSDSPDQTNMVPRVELIPMKISLLVLTIASVFCIFLLPESRSHKSRLKSRSASMISLQANRTTLPSVWSRVLHFLKDYVKPLRLLIYPSELKTEENAHRFWRVRVCVFCLSNVEILSGVIMLSVMLIELQYCIYKYKWDSVTISNFTIVKSLLSIVGMGVIVPILYKYVFPRSKIFTPRSDTFDAADSLVMIVGLFLMVVAQFGASLAPNGSIYILFAITNSLSTCFGPVSAAAPVKFFPSSKVGEYYGATALASGLLNLFTPMVSTSLYKYGIREGFPGMPFVLTSLLALVSFISTVIAKWSIHETRGSLSLG
ncbi:hypothetical protein FT663_01240 [Candidozyma haemuli var. vulneris]|uniref:Major facilitator superfamily (MFS) profile domain-containing protein n=1 Tax=Candidozyma haemuli TaxID=45357 RepID=A0A2V1AYG2_9ASCO|nr:hypothetical protein CXQ85_005107 [[Candida] haemuloni]KAF3992241.1 hypothetical protein FT662_01258 [[Candida] haemuloni var. vulneris]KAF3994662.1 hypothetical protein FT663_01240 [[Candida] haemuloni var. vulneris]PVH22536.1 hypothetical protein CXQ85_005107 [[Candida] haemuloni]